MGARLVAVTARAHLEAVLAEIEQAGVVGPVRIVAARAAEAALLATGVPVAADHVPAGGERADVHAVLLLGMASLAKLVDRLDQLKAVSAGVRIMAGGAPVRFQNGVLHLPLPLALVARDAGGRSRAIFQIEAMIGPVRLVAIEALPLADGLVDERAAGDVVRVAPKAERGAARLGEQRRVRRGVGLVADGAVADLDRAVDELALVVSLVALEAEPRKGRLEEPSVV